MIGILDLRSLGYYKIGKGELQQRLGEYYQFQSADVLYQHFNKFVNKLKNEKEDTKEKYL